MYGFIKVKTSKYDAIRIAIEDIIYYHEVTNGDRSTDPRSWITIRRGDYKYTFAVRETVEQLDSLIEAAENEKAAKLASALSSAFSRGP